MVNSLYKYAYHANWFLIFHHNSDGGYFSNGELLMYYSDDKYSALGSLEKYRRNGFFEFLLEYPELEGYNRFVQTSNPTQTRKISGYQKRHLSWEVNNFGGLALSSDTGSTFIDGSPGNGNGWHYAIGSYSKWGFGHIPGPYGSDSSYVDLKEVNLWIRIFDSNTCKLNHRNNIKLLFFITLSIS